MFAPRGAFFDRPQVEKQQRQSGQRLDQRRVLRVEPEVARPQIGVAGGQVGDLVPCDRLAPHAAHRQRREAREQQGRAGDTAHRFAAARSFRLRRLALKNSLSGSISSAFSRARIAMLKSPIKYATFERYWWTST